MPSSDPEQRLRDILGNISRIRSYVHGIDAQQLAADHRRGMRWNDAWRICEAARKLGDSLDAKYPGAEFPKLRQLGSVLRYDYDDIDTDLLWRSVTERLDPLEQACRNELARILK